MRERRDEGCEEHGTEAGAKGSKRPEEQHGQAGQYRHHDETVREGPVQLDGKEGIRQGRKRHVEVGEQGRDPANHPCLSAEGVRAHGLGRGSAESDLGELIHEGSGERGVGAGIRQSVPMRVGPRPVAALPDLAQRA